MPEKTSAAIPRTDLLRRRILQGLAATALPWAPLPGATRKPSPVVATTGGRVRGLEEGPVMVFKGIPYAADTATTRFRRPKPRAPWTGVREAFDYGPRCPQDERPNSGPRKLLASWVVPQAQSEDCLYLNVWTPLAAPGAARPVMVWIHGGGFANGSGAASVYEGSRLAAKGDVVVVTVNHRLNVFGYLCLAEASDEFADSGNVGQHDLIAALQWIRDNIGEFGGDPGNVTVFGESGGGAKISTLLAMHEARGLFHRAVMQSGPMLWAARMDSAAETGRMGLEALGADKGRLSRLDSASTEDLLRALAAIKANGRFRTLAPVVDGRGLDRHPFVPDAPPVSRDVPLMLGFTATESTLLLGFDDSLFTLSWADLPGRLAPFAGSADVAGIVAEYRAAFPEYSPSDVFFDVTTLQMIGRSAMHIADLKAAQDAAPVYLYELQFRTGVDDGKWRSPHTLDIPLVFDNVQKSGSMFGETSGVQRLADVMSSAWLEFAHSGTPRVPGLDRWPAWDATRATMIFDLDSRVAVGPHEQRAEILREVPYWDITQPSRL